MELVAANQNRENSPIIIMDLKFEFKDGKVEVTEVTNDYDL